MATYAIGDLQGCLREFRALLRKLDFSSADKLWLLGDLVNRGPDSLGTLELVAELESQCEIVLGNHDLHFLAIVYGGHNAGRSDTFDDLLDSPSVHELAAWLRSQKMVHRDPDLSFTMVHAGIPPFWSVDEAIELGREVEQTLSDAGAQSVGHVQYFEELYGNEPADWNPAYTGMDRLRSITNYLTRMRLVHASGVLDFDHKGALADAPSHLVPWYDLTAPGLTDGKLLFGHWAALDGVTGHEQIVALDTGCVWGRNLTALCLETGEIIRQQALS